MLEVETLHAGYGRIPILAGIGLAAARGDSIGILGHNGMGKTTLLRALIGQLPATAGRIRFNGEDVTRWSAHRRARAGMGYVPQGRAIFPYLTVRDNLRMGYIARGESERAVIDQVLADFPRLEPLLKRAGGTLSGGEQQLLALARALCGRPQLLLLDEPTEGIQPTIVEQILAVLGILHERDGLTLITVEQNLEFIASLARRVLLLQKGRVTREMPPGALGQAELMEEFVGMET
ncbi:MAG: ABC transporter ATP-binding protein [Stellaceae bacterium]